MHQSVLSLWASAILAVLSPEAVPHPDSELRLCHQTTGGSIRQTTDGELTCLIQAPMERRIFMRIRWLAVTVVCRESPIFALWIENV